MKDEMEQFESHLSRQPLRQIPGEWRKELLAVAKVQLLGATKRSEGGSTPISQLSTVFWPHPKAWAGLAVVWIFIFAVNFFMRDPLPKVAEKYTPPSPEVIVELKKQQRLFAELVGL
jgi:hypothetical protein